jgi:uncharacterized protein DUF4145
MKCPHCLIAFHDTWYVPALHFVQDPMGSWSLYCTQCPGCNGFTAKLRCEGPDPTQYTVWPKGVARAPLPSEVPQSFTVDYREACLVLADSPRASAALSRRCLQHLLREKGGVARGNLRSEIDQVISQLPPYLSEAIDAVRHYGNFAAP